MKKQKVSKEFWEWINESANFNKHEECLDSKYTIGKDKRPNHITAFGRGYHQAVMDIFLKLDSSNVQKTKKGEKLL